jgi:glutathione peroxidase-family protein
LHREYAARQGLRILAFPCNQFGKQEPGTATEIKQFAASFGAEFDMFDKIDVNGSHAHPLYRFLKSRVHKGLGSFIKWNFEKFICNADGIPVSRYYPTTPPLDLLPDLEKLWKAGNAASRTGSVRI